MDKLHSSQLPTEYSYAGQNDTIIALETANLRNTRLGLKNGIADPFGDETGIQQTVVAGNDSFTKLLLSFDEANNATSITNRAAGGAGVVFAGGDAKVSTAQRYFGTGSIALDGSTDYLFCDGNADFTLGTGDFTIDFRVMLASMTGCYFFDWKSGVQGAYPSLYLSTSPSSLVYYTNSTAAISAAMGSLLTTMQWFHIALVRSSGVTKLYLDGVQVGSSYTDATNYLGNVSRPLIGSYMDGSISVNGWMDEFRISKGIARWTANFTPPTGRYEVTAVAASAGQVYNPTLDYYSPAPTYPFGSIDPKTKFLLKGNGLPNATAFVDSALIPSPVSVALAGPIISNAQSKFGGSSIYFNGTTGAHLTIPDNQALELGYMDFCIDFWLRPDNLSATRAVMTKYQDASNYGFYIQQSSAALGFYASSNSTSWDILSNFASGYTLTAGVWSHCAFIRSGSTFSIYKDGVLIASTTSALPIANNVSPWTIGGTVGTPSFVGYLDEVRLSVGTPRWTGAFTPPTTEYIDSPVGNMTLITNPVPAATSPSLARVMLQVDTALTLVPNTDIVAAVSRDGATWATANLALVASVGTLKTYEDTAVNLVGIGAGVNMQMKVQTNGLNIPVTGVVEQWAA